MNQKMLFWILICLFINVTQQYDDNNQTYCYTNPSSYCVLCGCYQKGITQHTLSCREYGVIRMEPGGNPMKTRPYQEQYPASSCFLNEDLCRTGLGDTDLVTTYRDRVAVYKLCTLQNTCTFTVKPVDSGNVKVVRYPYVCEDNIISMSNPVSLQVTDPVLYFTGKDHVGENINCGCTVTPSDQQTMELEIFYINGDNMCNGVTFKSLDVIQCNNNTIQLYTKKIQVDDDVLNITIKDITATGDDVLYFKVHGKNVRVICASCLQKPDSTTMPSTAITMSTSNTVDLSQSTDQQDLNTTLITETSQTTETTSINNQQIYQKGCIAKEEYEEKLNETYGMFGGILAAIIIINILGIGIYCCIRKRNTTEKLLNAPNQPVSTNTEYAHTEFHPDTESSHYQELNVVANQNGTR